MDLDSPSLQSGQHIDVQPAVHCPVKPFSISSHLDVDGAHADLESYGQKLIADLESLKHTLKISFSQENPEKELIARAKSILEQWTPCIVGGCRITNCAVLALGLTFNALKDALEHGNFDNFIKVNFPQYRKSTVHNYRKYADIAKVEKYLHVPYTHLLSIYSVAQVLIKGSADPLCSLLETLGVSDVADLPTTKEEISRLFEEAVCLQKLQSSGVQIASADVTRLVSSGVANAATMESLKDAASRGENIESVVTKVLSMNGGFKSKDASDNQQCKDIKKLSVETSISRLRALLDQEIQANTLTCNDLEGFKVFLDKAKEYYEKLTLQVAPVAMGRQ